VAAFFALVRVTAHVESRYTVERKAGEDKLCVFIKLGSSSGEKSGSRFGFQVKLEQALGLWLYTTLSYSTHLI
jgi:hypothetical protein